MRTSHPTPLPTNLLRGSAFLLLALACFHIAYAVPNSGWMICGFPLFLIQALSHLSQRQGFYLGLLTGLLAYAPQLHFFAHLFGAAALLLWLILALWIAFFLVLGRIAIERHGRFLGAWLLPFLWIGLEYFRSELYYLRFSWMNSGYPLPDTWLAPALTHWGMYGIGFWLVGLGSAWHPRSRTHSLAAWMIVGAATLLVPHPAPKTIGQVSVAGMQLEESNPSDLSKHLDLLVRTHPEADLLVLHEYLLGNEPSTELKQWCRQNRKWLIIGGKRHLPNERWLNTAFVIDPTGRIVFEQGKSVPIQFFDDGIPAPTQVVWESPWGRIGIAVCYDLSYTRVMDRLIQGGAQALVIPTMDSLDWGRYQHGLHARVAPTRSREYGVGIFRVASSGISQLVLPTGEVTATAPCPGPEAMVAGILPLVQHGRLPWDRWLGPLGVGITASWVGWISLWV